LRVRRPPAPSPLPAPLPAPLPPPCLSLELPLYRKRDGQGGRWRDSVERAEQRVGAAPLVERAEQPNDGG
jgi:hypothetical protein